MRFIFIMTVRDKNISNKNSLLNPLHNPDDKLFYSSEAEQSSPAQGRTDDKLFYSSEAEQSSPAQHRTDDKLFYSSEAEPTSRAEDKADSAYYVVADDDDKREPTSRAEDKVDSAYYVVADGDDDEVRSEDAEASSGSDSPSADPQKRKPSAWKLFWGVVFSPVQGWKKLRGSKLKADEMAQGCYYQILALMAACNFAELFYVADSKMSAVLIESFILFITFFLSYFVIVLILRGVLPRDCREAFETDFGRNFVLVALATLAGVQISVELLPFLQPLLVFLGLYTVFLIVKGVRFLKAPAERQTMLSVVISILCIGVPIGLQMLFNLMLPKAS